MADATLPPTSWFASGAIRTSEAADNLGVSHLPALRLAVRHRRNYVDCGRENLWGSSQRERSWVAPARATGAPRSATHQWSRQDVP